MARRLHADWLMITLGYVTFVALGLGSALLGLAWPSIQLEFNAMLGEQGVLLIATTVGFLIASSSSGTLSARLGTGRYLVLGMAISAVCLFSVFFVQSWAMLVFVLLINGLGRGSVDAGLNAYMAQLYNARVINWLHAAFGVGITITPLIMTAVFSAELSWRYGYLIVSVFIALVVVLLFLMRGRWRAVGSSPANVDYAVSEAERTEDEAYQMPLAATLALPALWLAMGMAFLYAGTEGTPGNWIFTLFTQGRGINEVEAAQWVSVYWGTFTFGRMFFGMVIGRVQTPVLLRACMLVSALAVMLLWWNPVPWVGYIGLAVLGFSLAPIFPVLVSSVPRWVGKQHAANAVGLQIAVAGTGFTMIPALAGVIAQNTSLEAIPPLVLTTLTMLTVLYLVSEMYTSRKRKREAVSAVGGD